MRQLTALIAAALSLAGPRALAHHAFAAEFDINKPITIEGTVTEWEMINPVFDPPLIIKFSRGPPKAVGSGIHRLEWDLFRRSA